MLSELSMCRADSHPLKVLLSSWIDGPISISIHELFQEDVCGKAIDSALEPSSNRGRSSKNMK